MCFKKVLPLLLIGCSTGETNPPTQSVTLKQELLQLKEKLIQTAPTCQYLPDFIGPSKDTCWNTGTGSGDADIMLFAGLLCLSNEDIGCETVYRSIDNNGRPYRSPGRVGKDPDNTFSRDMFLGLMAYFATTKNRSLAIKFQKWLEGNENRLCADACDMRITTWGLMGEVWQYLGLTRTYKMIQGQAVDDITQDITSDFVEHGYREHLIAVTVLIRQYIGTYTENLKNAATEVSRDNPENPFFRYIVEGNSYKVQDSTLKICSIEPVRKNQWIWEEIPEKVNYSMGWDCVMLINLINKESK